MPRFSTIQQHGDNEDLASFQEQNAVSIDTKRARDSSAPGTPTKQSTSETKESVLLPQLHSIKTLMTSAKKLNQPAAETVIIREGLASRDATDNYTSLLQKRERNMQRNQFNQAGRWSKNAAKSSDKRASADFTTCGMRKSHRRLRSDQMAHQITEDFPIAQSVTLMQEEEFVPSSH